MKEGFDSPRDRHFNVFCLSYRLKKQKIRVATILPYKENYTFGKASAASLWVSEFYKRSKFGPFVYRLGHVVFILERGVRFP